MELLQMEDVSKRFLTREGSVQAVSHVSLTLQEGEILGVVGFSGSGKSTVLQLAAGLEKPEEGIIRWPVAADGHFYRHVQMVFQDPGAAFSPRMDIGTFLREPLLNFGLKTRGEADEAIRKMMEEIGAPLDLLSRLPSEVSGGQLQRIVIARALLVRPDIILFDEPTSALDVITQQKILSLIIGEHEKYGFAGIFVTHDLSVVQQVSQRVMVMEEGKVVEILPAEGLTRGLHPCTRKLIHAQIPEDGHPIPDAEEEGVLVYDGKTCTLVTDKETMKFLCDKGKEEIVTLSPSHMVRAYCL